MLGLGAARLGRALRQIVRSTSSQSPRNGVKFEMSPEEQERLLAVLNSPEQLARLEVPASRIRSLESWRSKHGPFCSLADVLDVDGLTERTFVALCNIITAPMATTTTTATKNRRQNVFPNLSGDSANTLRSAVGVHLTPTGVAWARLRRERNELDEWNYHNTTELPQKLLPVDTFQLATEIVRKIPCSDVYVMEAHSGLGTPGAKPPSPVHLHQLELSAMLLALLNTSPKHNDALADNDDNSSYPNKLFYLRSKLPARLFGTLLGNERVAANGLIRRLLDGDELPCTPVTVDARLRRQYESQTPALQDVMGQSLLLVVAFMDVCVYRNRRSLDALLPKRKKS